MKKFFLVGLVTGFKILLQNYTSLAVCPKGGLEVDLLVTALASQGFIESKDYTFDCINSIESIKSQVLSEPAIGIGGIRIDSNLLKQGFSFTHPTYFSGLNILINDVNLADPLKIFHAYTLTVWLFYLLIPFILGIVSWISSIIISDNPKSEMKDIEKLCELIWAAYRAWMFSSTLISKKSGRFLETLLSFFMVLFFLGLIAAFASSVYQKLLVYITKFGELAGQVILIEPQYSDLCGQYLLFYYNFPFDFYNDFDVALEMLKEKKFWGIIAENSYLIEKLNANTGFKINTEPFITFPFAGIYSAMLPNDVAMKVNYALAQLSISSTPYSASLTYQLNYSTETKLKEFISVSDCYMIFMGIGISIFSAVLLSLLPLKLFYAESWDSICRKRLQYFEELDITNRTEGVEIIRKKSIVENEKIDPTWTTEMSEDFVRIVRTSTLSLIEYENISLTWIDTLIAGVKKANREKFDLIQQVEEYLK